MTWISPQKNDGRDFPSIEDSINALTHPDFMNSLARGISVIRVLADSGRPLTIAQISRQTGIPRGAIERSVHTLKKLGYAHIELSNVTLRPKALALGYAYLSSTPLVNWARPCLDRISASLNESCSLAVLDEDEVIYLARSMSTRVMSVSLGAGSRLPAYCTSVGRVLLAHLPMLDLDRYLEKVSLQARTEYTVTEPARLHKIFGRIRLDGYALNNEELEIGLRSISVPVRGLSGRVQAALIVGAQTTRVSSAMMVREFLPMLLEGAKELSPFLGERQS